MPDLDDIRTAGELLAALRTLTAEQLALPVRAYTAPYTGSVSVTCLEVDDNLVKLS